MRLGLWSKGSSGAARLIEARKIYYESREFMSEREEASAQSLKRSQYAIEGKLAVHAARGGVGQNQER